MEKTTKKRNLIKESGRKLFLKHGVKRIKVEEICKVAGVSKKTFYNHFSNKFELAKVIIEEITEEEQRIFDTYRTKPISFQEKISIIIERKLENVNSAEAEFFEEVFETCEELTPFVAEKVQQARKQVLTFILAEQERGEIRREISPHLVLYLLVDQMSQMWYDPNLDPILPDKKDRARQLIEFFISGVSAKK